LEGVEASKSDLLASLPLLLKINFFDWVLKLYTGGGEFGPEWSDLALPPVSRERGNESPPFNKFPIKIDNVGQYANGINLK